MGGWGGRGGGEGEGGGGGGGGERGGGGWGGEGGGGRRGEGGGRGGGRGGGGRGREGGGKETEGKERREGKQQLWLSCFSLLVKMKAKQTEEGGGERAQWGTVHWGWRDGGKSGRECWSKEDSLKD